MPDLLPSLRAEIDLGAVRHNLGQLRVLAGPADVLGVVKADAYGHGAVKVAHFLRAEGVERLAVATLDEAAVLREAGVGGSLLVFAAPRPRHLGRYAALDADLTVSSVEVARAVADGGVPLRVHVKVDTGMHRLGVTPRDAPGVLARLREAPGIDVAALWTHFATADAEDPGFVAEQAARFQAVVDVLGEHTPSLVHVRNGPATVRDLGALRLPPHASAVVRTGGALYGLTSDAALAAPMAAFRPAMRLVSDVVHLQTVAAGETVSYGRTWRAEEPTRIATLAAGYADGVPRALSGRGEVGIGGRRWRIAGRVCMDMLMVDLGAPAGPGGAVALGDEAVLWGPGGPSAESSAAAAGTMAYELTAGLTARVARLYADPAGG